MGPEKWKGELPPDEAAESDASATREAGQGRAGGAGHESIDEREEQGYDQPESSAQKAPSPGPGAGEPSRE